MPREWRQTKFLKPSPRALDRVLTRLETRPETPEELSRCCSACREATLWLQRKGWAAAQADRRLKLTERAKASR